MKAFMPEFPHRRVRADLSIAFLGAAMFFSAPILIDYGHSAAVAVARSWPLHHQSPVQVPRLPFTIEDIAGYFATALTIKPAQAPGGALVFEDRSSVYREQHFRIVVSSDSNDLLVAFTAGGDYGVSLLREFFEAPLFSKAESERLYKLLNSTDTARAATLPRFKVGLSELRTSDSIKLTLRFSPSAST
jgi:hypothetical protein